MFVNYAHRGASAYYPENTLSAFYAGVHMGATGIETDVHKTSDGVLVLFHDDVLDRVTDGSGDLTGYTYEALLRFTVRCGEYGLSDKIPTLRDFLRYFGWRELTFAVELKQPHIERETIDLLDAFGMREKTILTSFDFDSLKRAKAYAPNYRVGYLFDEREADPVGRMRSIDGEELCPKAALLTPERTAQWHEAGFSVRAWGVGDLAAMRHVLACGADGMTVNFPDKLAEALK